MWINQIFSLINDNTIQNIVVCDNYEVANQIARTQYGDTAIAVDTTLYPVGIGCKYIDGKFFLDDVEISKSLTADEEAAEALQKSNTLEVHQVEVELNVDFRLSMIELGLV